MSRAEGWAYSVHRQTPNGEGYDIVVRLSDGTTLQGHTVVKQPDKTWASYDENGRHVITARTRSAAAQQHAEAMDRTGVVNLGTTPGECYGWECGRCDTATGLAFGDADRAQAALDAHVCE